MNSVSCRPGLSLTVFVGLKPDLRHLRIGEKA